MATYIDKINYNNNTYKLIDSGASHNADGILIGTTGDFKSNGTMAAEQGIFNKLIATSANISTLDVNNLTAVNATVVGLLDVQGEMHTKSWSNSNIATIDGSFYITPTSVSADGSDPTASGYTPTGTITYSNGNYTEMTITGTFDTSQITLDGTSSIAWPANSYVIITGEVSFGNKEWYPLGTIRGKLKSQIAASNASKTFTIIPIGSQIISGEVGNVSLTDGNGHKPTTLEAIRTAISNTSGASLNSLKLRKVKISMTSRANGSDQYALGIYMTAMGSNGKTFLDIYGGSEKNNTNTSIVIGGTTYQSGALAKPKVRIGNLLGLPALTLPNGESVSPTGWGIYTNNGFFEGTIVSQQGKIGNFTLGTAIYGAASGTGPSAISATTAGTYLGTDGFRNNKSGDAATYVQITNGVITAKGADISGAITASSLKINGTDYIDQIPTISSKASGDAEYSVEISTGAIDFSANNGNGSYPMTATIYKLGVKQTSGSFTFKWYKDSGTTAVYTSTGYTSSYTAASSGLYTVTIE